MLCLPLLALSPALLGLWSAPLEELTQEELVAQAAEVVLAAAAEDRFSGAVLITRDGEVLLEMAVGEASKRFHVDNRVDTKFNLGSMNKMFTAVAVAQLAEKGMLHYDDPISKYVDESWLPKSITDRVTVMHLLTHTSGLGSYFNETYARTSRDLFREVDDYKPLVNGETLAFEPGEGWAYSNTGMLLLGVVIEAAAKQNYFEYIREHVYAPAGMVNTDCYDMDQPVENLAIGYDADPTCAQGYRNNLYMHVIRGGPAGGGFSTVQDLNRFAQALLEGKLLSVESLDRLWTDHHQRRYGCGFSVAARANGKVVGHSGGFSGINSNLDICVDAGFVVAVMSNYSAGLQAVRAPLQALVERAVD